MITWETSDEEVPRNKKQEENENCCCTLTIAIAGKDLWQSIVFSTQLYLGRGVHSFFFISVLKLTSTYKGEEHSGDWVCQFQGNRSKQSSASLQIYLGVPILKEYFQNSEQAAWKSFLAVIGTRSAFQIIHSNHLQIGLQQTQTATLSLPRKQG